MNPIDKNKLVKGEGLSPEKFARPSREFGIMPFWFWNGEMDYDEMEYQLREYYGKGMPGLFIHARFGIRDYMPYLGDEWFKRVKFTIEKAQEIGLQVWVYDEYNWPSGTAGQTIQADHPELTELYLQLIECQLPGQYFSFLEGTDSRYFDMEQSEPVYACAMKLEDIEKGNFEYVDLTPSLSFDKVLTWEAPKGPWKQMYFIERKASWYTDVLNPETTKKFLEYTHERYKAAQGGKFWEDKAVLGFFTDEPAMLYFEAGGTNFILPWSKKIFKFFKERNGYDLRKNLPKLFYNVGDYEKVRHDFWRALSDQYDDAYYKQIGDWCKENKVTFTGHLMNEESIKTHAKNSGNLFKHLSHMELTGVDHLYPRIGTREMPNEHVALKIASSAAHQFGSTRLICESMGGSYWDCTMERMKWIADWEYVLGVNILNPHGYHYSIEGERKRDWPPSQFYHHTWWEYYGLFNDYLSRIGYTMTGGRHVAKIAVMYPIHSIWANLRPQLRDSVSALIEDDFVWLTDRLLRIHADFDYLDEDVLASCEIEGGKIKIKGEEYELLVFPPMTHIKQATLDILEKFKAQGGKLLGGALLPEKFVDSDDNGVQRIKDLFGTNIAKPWAENNDIEALRNAVFSHITPDITIDNDEVFYLHRIKDGRNFYFIINPTSEEIAANVTVEGEYAPEFWNLEDGSISKLPYSAKNGRTAFALVLYPFGSALVSVFDKPCQNNGAMAEAVNGYAVKELSSAFDVMLNKPNTILTGKYKLKVADSTEELDSGMGAWEMQLPSEFEGVYPVELTYTAEFFADFVPEDLKLLVDGFKGEKYELRINGMPVDETPERSYFDAEIKALPVKKYFKTGKNIVELKLTARKKSDGLVDLLKLIGTLSVETHDGKEYIAAPVSSLKPGDWVKQGLPYYSGAVTYTAKTNIPADWKGKKVFLDADIGTDVLEVRVNGKAAGIRLWKPYRIDLGELKTGENIIDIKVTNTLMNMLEASKTPSGLFAARLEVMP
jgi:hypothetical protein